jgi:hypothetical protein
MTQHRVRRQARTEEEAKEALRDCMGYEQPEYPRDREVFRTNLRRLVETSGRTPRDLAEEIGVQRRWFVRLCRQGLARMDHRYRPSLAQVARRFGLGEDGVGDLWNPARRPPEVPLERLRPLLQNPDWQYAESLLHLLGPASTTACGA